MDAERRPITLISPDGHILPGDFLLWEESPVDADRVRLSIMFGEIEIVRDAEDFFIALQSIRSVIGSTGLLPRCYGSSRNVYPSGMSRGMGTGARAYKLYLGHSARMADLVDIFDDAADVEPVSVDVQEAFYQSWLDSIMS